MEQLGSISKFDPDNGSNGKKEETFGTWKVSLNGDMEDQNGTKYSSKQITTEDDFIVHMMEKSWIDLNDFIPAYFQACTNAGIQFVKIKIHY